MKDDYYINSYIKDDLLYNYYRYINLDFINNKLNIRGPYIQILCYYRNPILRICSQLEIYLSFIEKTNEDVLNYLLELYIHSLFKIKLIEMDLIDILNPKIKRLIEIFYFSKDQEDPKFNSKSFLSHKQDFLTLIKMISNMERHNLTSSITDLIDKILKTNITVNLYYKIEDTLKFEDDLLTYYEYKQEFMKQQKEIRRTIENYDYMNDNQIDIPPIDKTFNFNNLLLCNDNIVEDKFITYTLFKIDVINVLNLRRRTKRTKKYKQFISMMDLIKENDGSLTSIDPFLKKYNKHFEPFIEYINLIYKNIDEAKLNSAQLFFIPYCIIHVIPKYELHKFINSINPLLKIKKNQPILITDDNDIINLFNEQTKPKPKPKNKNKNKNKPKIIDIDISNISNDNIIELNESIEQIEEPKNTENETIENESIENENESIESDDDEGFKLVTYKTKNTDFDYYDIVFNNIHFNNKNIIEILIYRLYESNNNFIELMRKYNIIRIIKDIHEDSFYLNETLHFNSILINSKNGTSTSPLHFYIENNKIVNITQVINLI